jgi:hypothetical protein
MSIQGNNSAIVFRDKDKVAVSHWKKGDFSGSCKYTGVDSDKMYRLRLAANAGFYYMPLVTTYTIRMQSNPFVTSPDGSEQWAGKDDNNCS